MPATKYQSAFTRYMAAVGREAERRTLYIQVTLAVSTVVLIVATIISLFRH